MGKKHKFMTVNTVMNESFNLYFKNFLRFVIPAACVYLPLFAFMIIPMYQNGFENFESMPLDYGIGLSIGYFIFGIAVIPLYYTLTKIISNSYTDKTEELKPIIIKGLKRFFSFWWMHILMFLMLMLGFLLLIIPMYIFMIAMSLSQPAFVLEEKGPFKSLKRSWGLTKGFKGKIFGIFFLVGMILYTMMVMVMLIGAGSIFGISAAAGMSMDNFNGSVLLIAAVYCLSMIALTPFLPVFTVVIYYNILKEREGFDTINLASSFMDERQNQAPAK